MQQHPPQQYPPQQYPPQQYPPQQYPPQQMIPQQMAPQQYGQLPPQQIIVIQQQAPVPKKKKGWERIDRDNLFIKQVFNWTEAVTGCEMPSTFKMYPLGKDGDKKGKALFKAKEESSCCERQCYPADCRPFSIKVKLDDDDEELDSENFLRLNRECKCTLWCLNRPEVTVHDIEDGKDVYIGKVVAPWTMCNVQLDIFDASNTLKYTVEASCCQLGFFCQAPCEACQTIDFEIKSPSGEVVSTLQKRAPSCFAAMVSATDNFLMHFPKQATKEDKALIMSAVLFADYRFFEEKKKKQGEISI